VRVVVTGAAGFVGSHLVDALVRERHQVVALDCLLPDSYDPAVKAANFAEIAALPGVELCEADLRTSALVEVLAGADAIVNEAAMPGLVKSWSEFDLYVGCNLLALDRLLAAARVADIQRIVHISTSSVYGRYAIGAEDQPTEPYSPYGVSKLAAEKLLLAHVANFGTPAVILRYFSLYGPRQRPDMAYHRFCEAMLDGRPLVVHGDGRQRRTNTHVHDAVAATIAALDKGAPGEILNVAGGESVRLLEAISILSDALDVEPTIEYTPPRPGDQRDTAGDVTRARQVLDWTPRIGIAEGLRDQAAWHQRRRSG